MRWDPRGCPSVQKRDRVSLRADWVPAGCGGQVEGWKRVQGEGAWGLVGVDQEEAGAGQYTKVNCWDSLPA